MASACGWDTQAGARTATAAPPAAALGPGGGQAQAQAAQHHSHTNKHVPFACMPAPSPGTARHAGLLLPRRASLRFLRSERCNEKCDVYSYGVILYELTTGQEPWGELKSMQVRGQEGVGREGEEGGGCARWGHGAAHPHCLNCVSLLHLVRLDHLPQT